MIIINISPCTYSIAVIFARFTLKFDIQIVGVIGIFIRAMYYGISWPHHQYC